MNSLDEKRHKIQNLLANDGNMNIRVDSSLMKRIQDEVMPVSFHPQIVTSFNGTFIEASNSTKNWSYFIRDAKKFKKRVVSSLKSPNLSNEVTVHRESEPKMDRTDCIPMYSWQEEFHPNCNSFHEVELMFSDYNISLLGNGGWRDAWRINPGFEVILKTLRWRENFDKTTFDRHQIDAIVADRVSPSPYTISIYGFCGESTFNELGHSSLLDQLEMNRTSSELLRLAFGIAQGVADLNYLNDIKNATIAHNDIKPANIIFVGDTPKLNDFNDCQLLWWNKRTQSQCLYKRPETIPWVRYRAPEQTSSRNSLTYAVDSYGLGNVLFHLLTGKKPYFELKAMSRARELTKDGISPRLPDFYRQSKDPAISLLVSVIDELHQANPRMRKTTISAAAKLRKVIEQTTFAPSI